jgi:hypothetical protein
MTATHHLTTTPHSTAIRNHLQKQQHSGSRSTTRIFNRRPGPNIHTEQLEHEESMQTTQGPPSRRSVKKSALSHNLFTSNIAFYMPFPNSKSQHVTFSLLNHKFPLANLPSAKPRRPDTSQTSLLPALSSQTTIPKPSIGTSSIPNHRSHSPTNLNAVQITR